jgi:hypothetical protein
VRAARPRCPKKSRGDASFAALAEVLANPGPGPSQGFKCGPLTLTWSCGTSNVLSEETRATTYHPEFRRRVLELVGVGRPEQVSPPELELAEAMAYR